MLQRAVLAEARYQSVQVLWSLAATEDAAAVTFAPSRRPGTSEQLSRSTELAEVAQAGAEAARELVPAASARVHSGRRRGQLEQDGDDVAGRPLGTSDAQQRCGEPGRLRHGG